MIIRIIITITITITISSMMTGGRGLGNWFINKTEIMMKMKVGAESIDDTTLFESLLYNMNSRTTVFTTQCQILRMGTSIDEFV